MKVMFFVGEFSDGGAERVISIIANNIVNSYDVEILSYFKKDSFYKTDDRVVLNSIEANTNSTNKIKNLKWLRKHIKDVDIIISFLAPFNILSLLANIGINKPIIVSDRNDPRFVPNNTFIRFLRDRLYGNADAIVVQTENNKEYFKKYSNKTYVIPNPLNMDNFIGIALNETKQKKIVNVGRLKPQKNQELLIDAFNEIHKKYPEYTLHIYGIGPYENELKDLVKLLNLSDSVIFEGQRDDIFNDIKDSELFVLSSNYEGMPNALIEAMALGLPCISTDVSGARDMIENDINGIVVPINDKDRLVNSMFKVIENKEYASSLANNACKISESLKQDVILDKWHTIINNIKK